MSTQGLPLSGAQNAPGLPPALGTLTLSVSQAWTWQTLWSSVLEVTQTLQRRVMQETGLPPEAIVVLERVGIDGTTRTLTAYRRTDYEAYQANHWLGTDRSAIGWAITGQPAVQRTFIKAPEEVQEETDMKLANRFKVGCDPEFAVLDKAGNLIVTHAGGLHDQIGSDHSGRVVELRPTPAKSTYTLLRRIKNLLAADALKPYENFRWKAGAVASRKPQLLTLGGHVHLDTLKWSTVAHSYLRQGLREWDTSVYQLADTLDRVTMNLERLDLLPRAEAAERRRQGFYGKLGDWKTSPGSELEGADEHFEYRTMSSWLYSPASTMIALTSAKLAAVDPTLAMNTLPRTGASFERLKAFFEAFKGKDIDATRVCEKLLDAPKKILRPDETADFKARWSELPC